MTEIVKSKKRAFLFIRIDLNFFDILLKKKKEQKRINLRKLVFTFLHDTKYKELAFFLFKFLKNFFEFLEKKKEETNYISFPSRNLRISKIEITFHNAKCNTYPRFCIQVLDRPTYRLSPHGRKRAQDCTDTWMPLRSNSSRTRRISFRPGKYRTDADNAAC